MSLHNADWAFQRALLMESKLRIDSNNKVKFVFKCLLLFSSLKVLFRNH